jgi:protocatechuate 3,4-dioxygenase, alpha subunit
VALEPTPSQTVGPFFSLGLCGEPSSELVSPDAEGAVRIAGRVLDGAGEPIVDALVETWQDDPPAFARCPTDDEGRWHVQVPRAPYLAVHVFARGLLRHLTTRICFDASAIPDGVPDDRRDTLLPEETADGYRFDIRIQGDGETVFFDL